MPLDGSFKPTRLLPEKVGGAQNYVAMPSQLQTILPAIAPREPHHFANRLIGSWMQSDDGRTFVAGFDASLGDQQIGFHPIVDFVAVADPATDHPIDGVFGYQLSVKRFCPFGCRTHFCGAAGGPYKRREVVDLIRRLEDIDTALGGVGPRTLPVAVKESLALGQHKGGVHIKAAPRSRGR